MALICGVGKARFGRHLNRIVGVGGFRSPPPLRFSACHCQTAGDRELKLSYFSGTFCEILTQGQVRSADPPLTKSRLRHGYSSLRISMTLAGLLSVISTYKMHV